MTEQSWTPRTSPAILILESDDDTKTNFFTELADKYVVRLQRIFRRLATRNALPKGRTIAYYEQAEAAVRALYADAALATKI